MAPLPKILPCKGLFLDSEFYSNGIHLAMPAPHCLGHYKFVVSLKSGNVSSIPGWLAVPKADCFTSAAVS